MLMLSSSGEAVSVADFYTAPLEVAENGTCHLLLRWARSVQKEAFQQHQIQKLFEPYGEIAHIFVNEGAKRTAIVSFKQLEDAKKAMDDLKGKKIDAIYRKVLHMEYALQKEAMVDGFCHFLNIPNVSTDPNQELIPGLYIFHDFISKEEEVALLNEVDQSSWTTMSCRNVQHFGYEFDYRTRRCDPNQPLNNMSCGLFDITNRIPDVMPIPDQITANSYEPGQGIAPHIDTHSAFKGGIGSLTLGGGSVMDFKHPDGSWKSFYLPQRSLLVMTGASRYLWTHAIQNRKTDLLDGEQVARKRRVSLTFRKLSSAPCDCDFPDQCDTQAELRAAGDQPHKLCPTEMEKKYVHDFYDTIASHFSKTRYMPWPRVAQFVKSLPEGSLIADIGCGNGKYMNCVENNSFAIGGDYSSKLVDICKDRGFEVMVFDAVIVPLRSSSFDAALSIAVLHHLSTIEHRLSALRELTRVLRVDGKGLVYVWALEQQKDSKRQFDQHKQDIMVPWNLQKKYATEDTKNDIVVQRYCHVYHEMEIDELVRQIPNVVIEDSYYDHSNWCVQFRKISETTSI